MVNSHVRNVQEILILAFKCFIYCTVVDFTVGIFGQIPQ